MLNKENIVDYALSIDIPIIGFSKTNIDHKIYRERIQNKINNNTLYPRKQNINEYFDIEAVLKDSKTIISIGIPYSQNSKYVYKKNQATFSITSYGLDYHKVLYKKMSLLVEYLLSLDSTLNYYYQCDTKKLDDRYFAYLCSNGAYGKHSQIINPKYGSQVFYGTIIIDKDVVFENSNYIEDLCGECTLCLDACPTKSINNYQINYNSCLSYISQSNNLIDPLLLDNCFYGCDKCGNVCPYNRENSYDKNFFEDNANIDLIDFLSLSKNEYNKRYQDKSFKWLNRNILRKNIILMLDLNEHEIIELKNNLLQKNNSELLKKAFDFKLKRNK